jgi:hypothetical protein
MFKFRITSPTNTNFFLFGINNIYIESLIDSIPDTSILSVSIDSDTLFVSFRPIFPNVQYKMTFSHTSSVYFQSVNGEPISENGNSNVLYFTSPGEESSPIRDNMLDELPVVYEKDEQTLVRKLIVSFAKKDKKFKASIRFFLITLKLVSKL